MLNVMVQACLEVEAGVGPEAALADPLIEVGTTCRSEGAVHGVVRHDEQSGVQKAAQDHEGDEGQRVDLLKGKAKPHREGEQPGEADQPRQLQSLPVIGPRGITCHQA